MSYIMILLASSTSVINAKWLANKMKDGKDLQSNFSISSELQRPFQMK